MRGSRVGVRVCKCVCGSEEERTKTVCERWKKINKSSGSDAVGRRRSISVDPNTNKIEGEYRLELRVCVCMWVGLGERLSLNGRIFIYFLLILTPYNLQFLLNGREFNYNIRFGLSLKKYNFSII